MKEHGIFRDMPKAGIGNSGLLCGAVSFITRVVSKSIIFTPRTGSLEEIV